MYKLKTLVAILSTLAISIAEAKPVSFTLANDLQIVVDEDPLSKSIDHQIWYKVGAAYEPEGLTGISHFLEHMMFKGTSNVPKDHFFSAIASQGGQQNAFTNQDHTVYHQTIAPGQLELLFKLEADRMQNLSLEKDEFAKERQVVMEERRSRTDDNPIMSVRERFLSMAHLTGPYHLPVVGSMQDIENITLGDMAEWYQRYAPNNAVIVVKGKVKLAEVKDLAEKYFANISPRKLPKIYPFTQAKPYGERRLSIPAEAEIACLYMAYNVPVLKTSADPKEAYALDCLNMLLSSGRTSRFYQALISNEALASTIESYVDNLQNYSGLLEILALPAKKIDLPLLENSVLQEISKLQTETIDQDELENLQTKLMAATIFARDSQTHVALELGNLAALNLPIELQDDYLLKIAEVTPEDIQTVAKKYLKPENLTVAYLLPKKILQAEV